MTRATFLFSHGLADTGLEVRGPADDALLAVVRSDNRASDARARAMGSMNISNEGMC